VPVTVPGPTTLPPPTVPGQTTLAPTTTSPPTTVPRPLDSLPPCDVDVLDEASADGPVDLLFWHGLSNENGRTMERIVDQYNQSQTRVHVRLEFQGGYEQSIDKYLQSNTDNRPDLVQIPEYATQLMIDTKSTVPMQACMESAAFDSSALLPAALSAYSAEGVEWSMPLNVSNPVLYYNKKIFRDAGLDPEQPPLTLAEVAEDGRIIQQTGAAAYGLVLDTAPDGGGGWFLEQWLAKQGEFYSDNDNGRSAPSTRVLFDGAGGVALMTELRDVVLTGGGYYVGENPDGQQALLKLASTTDPATMTISTSAGLGPVLAFVEGGIIPGIGSEDIGVSPMPSPNGAPGALIGGNSLWITAGRGDDKAAAAWDFTSWLVSAEVQSDFAASTGYVPVNSGSPAVEPLLSLYTSDPRFKVAYDQVAQTPDIPTSIGPNLGPQREIRVTAAAAMGRILNGADPATELAVAAGEANALIADYNARRDAGG
jgi:sn-glycerol 3-phosphate transport system substrate-binding protein